ncbi:conserved hypothetical protein [Culex quinquefasciatus]|uniref:Homeobox domain-containing protein n=1 Tax=Culex quinquefasciatus TaxID=7176 RepID=B0WAP4_CULQU|nr:conserved hypothetical protein [Culex quinquefasciatus]|eukprot:XP_001845778.1 conserved hypothetical protein [Culex quinquefasciatus]
MFWDNSGPCNPIRGRISPTEVVPGDHPGESDPTPKSPRNTDLSKQSHLNLFANRPQPKKKRKSRTAFTNTQIFELEKRFLYQKYLSPSDRDEIAAALGLSNAQVITWFQNRRAKLKRDMEELKKDVETVKVLSAHKTFLENVNDMNILKKKIMHEDSLSPQK